MILLAIGYYICEYLSDRRTDYENEEINYYPDITGTFIYVPKYFFKPKYNKEVEKRFDVRGEPIKNENVDTGYIKITEKLGIEKVERL